MSLTTGDQSRYAEYRSHFVPRTRTGRLVVGLFLLLFACAEWPILPLANRIDPTFLGMPFLFVYLAVIYAALIAVLIHAARRRL